MHCSTCDTPIDSINDTKRGECFSCHVKNIRFGFTYGKESFHGPTAREQQRVMEDSPRYKAGEIERVPQRAILI